MCQHWTAFTGVWVDEELHTKWQRYTTSNPIITSIGTVFTWQFWSGQCLRQLLMVHVRASIQTKERHIIFTPSYRCEYWKVFSEPYVLRVTFLVRKLLLNNNNNNVNWICIALFKVLHIKSIINLCHIWHTSGGKLHVYPQLPWDSLAKAWLPISAKQPLCGHTTEH